MKVAALFDIHGNLPALEAVMKDVRAAKADAIVVGGDVVPGPMPRESLRLLLDLEIPVHFIRGNCERATVAMIDATPGAAPSYWGTTSGRPLGEVDQANFRWTAEQLKADFRDEMARWPRTLQLKIEGVGEVLFCHSTPRSEEEIFTRLTPEERLLPLFEPFNVDLAVCGHTHMQFDRRVGRTRVLNAGSVGAPLGRAGADWLLLGPGVELRHTSYDLERAAARIRATDFPGAEAYAAETVLAPPNAEEMLQLYTRAQLS